MNVKNWFIHKLGGYTAKEYINKAADAAIARGTEMQIRLEASDLRLRLAAAKEEIAELRAERDALRKEVEAPKAAKLE